MGSKPVFCVRSALCGLLVASSMGMARADDSEWFARVWQVDDGLPGNTITGLAQGPDGFLWVGTHSGLVRFDGVKVEEFSPAVLAGVPNRVVRALFRARDGRLWLGMDRGPIVSLRPDAADVVTREQGLPDGYMTGMAEDGEGAIWVGYLSGEVVRIREGDVTRFTARDGLPEHGASKVIADMEGRIWVSKSGRAMRFAEDRFVTVVDFGGSDMAMGASRDGGAWIFRKNELLKHDGHASIREIARAPHPVSELNPVLILEDQKGMVWIGTAANGLFLYDGTGLRAVSTSHRAIWSLSEDSEGSMWVGTGGGGVNRLRRRSVRLMSVEDGLPYEAVQSVSEDVQERLWVVMEDGAVARQSDDGGWRELTREEGWTGEEASCVVGDQSGQVWIGTRGEGLHRLRDGKFEVWRRTDGLASDDVRSLLVSSTGDLWIGLDSPNVVQRLSTDGFRTYEIPEARSIRAMAEDAGGAIYIGTADGQLWRVEEDEMTYATPTGDNLVSIRALHATDDGSLWIGYAGWGLGRLKDGRFGRITREEGLYDRYISQIVADKHGGLWLGGNRGIFQARLSHLNDLLDGRASQVRCLVYGPGEGLPSLQATANFSPSALLSRDGDVCIATRKGLVEIETGPSQGPSNPPSVIVERVVVDGETLGLYDSGSPLHGNGLAAMDLRSPMVPIHLGPEHRKVEIHFTAPSFTAPENVHFRYRLDGFDDDWVEARTQRAASYPRLPAGEYRFDVMASNDAGEWSQEAAFFHLSVAPFFWETWWFRLSTLGAFTVGLGAAVRFLATHRLRRRLRELEQQAALHRERARIAKDIHDDLGASLTQIALLGDLAQQDRAEPRQLGRRIEEISGSARNAIKALDEIVWAVNPGNDTLPHLTDYIGQYALDYLRVAGIRCRIDIPDHLPEQVVSTDVRHNLFLVVKEAIHNVVKHADATEVWLRMIVTDKALRIEVQDNGRGFKPGSGAHADGVGNMRQRMAEVGGSLAIEGPASGGTAVVLDYPWRR